MKFIIGEGGWSWLERASYRGAIGLFYNSTWEGVLTYLIFGIICVLAVVGLFTVLNLIFGRKKKASPEDKWLKSGKY